MIKSTNVRLNFEFNPWQIASNHSVLRVDWGWENLREVSLCSNVRWVMLIDMLRHCDVLNHLLSIRRILGWWSDDLWAHELVFKGLLIFRHSSQKHLNVLLSANKHYHKSNERVDQEIIDTIVNTLFCNRFLNSWHPKDVVLLSHLRIGRASWSLEFDVWWLLEIERLWLLNCLILVKIFIFTINVMHSVIMGLQFSLIFVMLLMRMIRYDFIDFSDLIMGLILISFLSDLSSIFLVIIWFDQKLSSLICLMVLLLLVKFEIKCVYENSRLLCHPWVDVRTSDCSQEDNERCNFLNIHWNAKGILRFSLIHENSLCSSLFSISVLPQDRVNILCNLTSLPDNKIWADNFTDSASI